MRVEISFTKIFTVNWEVYEKLELHIIFICLIFIFILEGNIIKIKARCICVTMLEFKIVQVYFDTPNANVTISPVGFVSKLT